LLLLECDQLFKVRTSASCTTPKIHRHRYTIFLLYNNTNHWHANAVERVWGDGVILSSIDIDFFRALKIKSSTLNADCGWWYKSIVYYDRVANTVANHCVRSCIRKCLWDQSRLRWVKYSLNLLGEIYY